MILAAIFMFTDISIRRASLDDIPILALMRYEFRAEHAPAVESAEDFLPRCERWMHERLRPGGLWHCWVAENAGEIIGCIWLGVVEKIPNPAPEAEHHAYITNFYIQKEARNTGLGSQLLDVALDRCRETNIHAAILWPSDRSRSLYERNGFAVRDDVLELIITPK